MNKSIDKFEKFFVISLIITFFIYNLNRCSYGLPFFLNSDEVSFKYSTLNFLKFLTGEFHVGYNLLYASFINFLLILKFVFINEVLINSLNLDETYLKIYFNPELFIYYGRVASLFITSCSIYFLYLIFKKLKIHFFIYTILLISLLSSLLILDISIINGKNSYYLLFFLIQVYFLIKYLLKINNFNSNSYIIFGILASLAWGVNYWPAFISIYSIFLLHFTKFKFAKIKYIILFFSIFIIFGPLLNLFYAESPWQFIGSSGKVEIFNLNVFLKEFINDFIISFKFIYLVEKNIIFLIFFLPFLILNKNFQLKKEFLIIFFLIFEPIILFGVSEKIFPQLRYFAGNVCLILILTSIICNEFYKNKKKLLVCIILLSNTYFIYNNIIKNININNIISKNSFLEFNKNIKVDKKKILYLVDLKSKESLLQNQLYIKFYDKGVIKNLDQQNNLIKRIENKIEKIKKNKNNTEIIYENLKKDIVYYSYSNFEIVDFKIFFDVIKEDFEYVVIEESQPFYLSNYVLQKKIKEFVKEHFKLEYTQFTDDKIFLKSLRHAIHYSLGTITSFDYGINPSNHKLEKIYGNNYSLYKLNYAKIN
jgi:hypothetical protein